MIGKVNAVHALLIGESITLNWITLNITSVWRYHFFIFLCWKLINLISLINPFKYWHLPGLRLRLSIILSQRLESMYSLSQRFNGHIPKLHLYRWKGWFWAKICHMLRLSEWIYRWIKCFKLNFLNLFPKKFPVTFKTFINLILFRSLSKL